MAPGGAFTGKRGRLPRLGEGLNRLAGDMGAALEQVIQVKSGLARGDLSKRIEGEFRGDLLRLKTDTNATACSGRHTWNFSRR